MSEWFYPIIMTIQQKLLPFFLAVTLKLMQGGESLHSYFRVPLEML